MGKTEKFDPGSHIGEVHGIYKIVDVLDEKDKYGHWIYKGVCQKCGHEKYSHYGDFSGEKSKVTVCTHQKNIEKKFCLNCGEEIPRNNLRPSEYSKRKFCCVNCYRDFRKKNKGLTKINKKNTKNSVELRCINCDKILVNGQKKYCSHQCQMDFQQKEWESKWLSGEMSGFRETVRWGKIPDRIRTYLFKKYDSKCAVCGWGETNPYTGKIPLEVEHIDGDYRNNRPENLTLLCPNCHSLTSTYRGVNIGHGRWRTLMVPEMVYKQSMLASN